MKRFQCHFYDVKKANCIDEDEFPNSLGKLDQIGLQFQKENHDVNSMLISVLAFMTLTPESKEAKKNATESGEKIDPHNEMSSPNRTEHL